jgi:hypothetical protein
METADAMLVLGDDSCGESGLFVLDADSQSNTGSMLHEVKGEGNTGFRGQGLGSRGKSPAAAAACNPDGFNIEPDHGEDEAKGGVPLHV